MTTIINIKDQYLNELKELKRLIAEKKDNVYFDEFLKLHADYKKYLLLNI